LEDNHVINQAEYFPEGLVSNSEDHDLIRAGLIKKIIQSSLPVRDDRVLQRTSLTQNFQSEFELRDNKSYTNFIYTCSDH